MHEDNFERAVELIRNKDPRFLGDAYMFVREALDHTQKLVGKDNRGRIRHVTGQELLDGIRDFALREFGPMAITVFEEWGIHSCQDFGDIVFNMVDIGVLAKTEKDSRSDFLDGYEFFDAFRKPFLPSSRQLKGQRETAPSSRR